MKESTKQNIESSTNLEQTKETTTNSNPDQQHNNCSKADEYEYSFKEDALELASLSFKEKITRKKEQQQLLLSTMDSKEKTTYIIQYYKWYFVFALFAIVCFVQIGINIYQKSLPSLLNIAFINNTGYSQIHEYVPDSYRLYYDLNTRNQINVYTNLYKFTEEYSDRFSMVSPIQQEMTYDNIYEDLDVIICDQIALIAYASCDETIILDQCIDESIYNEIKNHMVSASDPSGVKNNGEPFHLAIDISNTTFAKNCKLSYDTVYLLIPNTENANMENAINFIKFVFEL